MSTTPEHRRVFGPAKRRTTLTNNPSPQELANNGSPAEVAAEQQAYADIVAYEHNWPAKVAANTAAMNQRAAEAARIDAQTKQRQAWDQQKNPYTKKGK